MNRAIAFPSISLSLCTLSSDLSSIILNASYRILALCQLSLLTTRPLGSAYLVSPCSSAPFRWGRRSCLGLRTGVSPHFSMNSMREILALRGGYERGRVPLPSPMPPESGALPNNTHPSMIPPRHPRRPCPLFFVLTRTTSRTTSRTTFCPHRHSNRSPPRIPHQSFFRGLAPCHEHHYTPRGYYLTRLTNLHRTPRSRTITNDE